MNLSKRERLQVTRQRAKLEKNLGSISELTRLPSALFIVDINKEHIAVAEAKKLNIPTFAIVDTNTNPNDIDFPIPGNDDASKSIQLIVKLMVDAIEEGLAERKFDKDRPVQEDEHEEITAERAAYELLDEEEVATAKAAAIKKVKVVDAETDEMKPKAVAPRKQIAKKGGKK